MKGWQLKKRNADLERELHSDLELEEEKQREGGISAEEAEEEDGHADRVLYSTSCRTEKMSAKNRCPCVLMATRSQLFC